jgi:hypothetical protein
MLTYIGVWGQCGSNTNANSCLGCTAEINNNININGGQRYCWNRGSIRVANVNFGGGAMVICSGTVTVSSANFNGGTIVVQAGASLVMENNASMNNFTIVNFGTITFNSTVALQPVAFYNNVGAVVNFVNTLHINSSSVLVNSGLVNASNVTLQTNSGPSVCQNTGAIFNAVNLTNNTLNSIQSPSGNSCLRVSQTSLLNQNVSPHGALQVCLGAGHQRNGSANFGSATVAESCADCEPILLSNRFLYFDWDIISTHKIQLNWSAELDNNGHEFIVERSADGIIWTFVGNKFKEENGIYNIIDEVPYIGTNYYRIKLISNNNSALYSDIISINIGSEQATNLKIYPNPTDNNITIIGDEIQLKNIKNLDVFGRDVTNSLLINSQNLSRLELDLSGLPSGMYYLVTGYAVRTIEKR